ncbi:MAG: hypothetical protein WCA37_00685 [Terracidiphilus sp.]
MATQVIRNHNTDVLEHPVYSGSLVGLLASIDRDELVEDERELSVSTGKALGGARSIFAALGLEGGVAAVAFLLWQIVHSVR